MSQLFPFLAALLCQAPAGDAAARLVPDDAVALVRIESLAALAGLANAFQQLEGEVEPYTPARILADLPYPGPAENVDPARPVYFALAFTSDQPAPGMTWIVPLRAGVPHGIDNSEGVLTLHAEGDYLAVTDRPGAARPGAPSPLVAALVPGVAALHLDLAALVARFRPLLDTGLRQAETMVASLPRDESLSFDPEAIFEWYLELARDTLASAEALDLALAHQGDALTLRGRYLVKEGSVQVAPLYTTVPLAPLAGWLDPEHPVQVLMNASPGDFLAQFEGLTEMALEIYPEPFRGDVERALELQRGLRDAFAPGLAIGTDFTTEGVHLYYVLRAKEPARVSAGIEEMVRAFDHGDGMVAVGAAERLAVAGFEGRVLPVELRHEAMQALLAGAGAEPPEELGREVEQAMDTLYGRNLRLAIATRGELVALVLANNDSLVRADLERLARPALPASKVLALAEEIPAGAFGLVQHFDFGRTMGRMMAAMRGVMDLPFGVFPELDFSFDLWGAVAEREYTGGARMDLAELLAFAKALREFEGK